MTLSHEIHTSARRSFKGCRRRWDWHFRENWTPYGMAEPLEFGIAFHAGMEVLYDPETWSWDKAVVGELAVKKFVDECNSQRETFLRENDDVALESSKQEEYDARVELGKGMLRYYYTDQLPKNPDAFRPIKVEIAFQVPIMHPDTGQPLMCKCQQCWSLFQLSHNKANERELTLKDEISWPGLPVTYAGRIDALGEDINGEYWIIDWKTARSISTDEEFLYLDDQIGSYVWALRKILNLPVRGFIYHEQKKGYPKPPTENKVVRKGCKFSVNKQQDTDYETYLATVKEHDAEAYAEGCYDEMLDFLKEEGTVFFKRWQITKNDYELEQIGINIGLEALDMIDPGLRIYPSAGKFGCKFCAFRQPCMGKNRGEDYTYALKTLFKQEPPYWYRQVKGASTESKGGE